MKHKIFFLLLFIGFSLPSFAQYTVKFSPEYKLAKRKSLQGHLHSNSTGHYMYFKELKPKSPLIFEKYDSKFKQVYSKEFVTNKKNIYSLSMKYFKDKFAWLQAERNKSDDYIQYYITPIDMNGKASKPKKIARFVYKTKKDYPTSRWYISKDTTKFLFMADTDRNNKKENYEAYVSILDNDFNKLYDKKIKLPYSEKRVDIESVTVTELGEVFFVAKIYEDNKKKESRRGKGNKRAPAYDMKLYKIDKDTDKTQAFELKLEDAFVKGIKLEVDNSDDIACVGFYGDSKNGPLQGVFYLKLSSKDGNIEFANKRRFTPKELDAFGKKGTTKDKKSNDVGLNSRFVFNKILIQDNGEIFVSAEENYSYTVTSSSQNGTYTTTYYVSNSIVVINIGSDGVVSNVTLIPKKQKMQSTTYQKYATLKSKDKIYFVYNDDKDNLKRNITDPDKYKRVSSAKDCIAVMTTIDKNGKIKKKELFNKKEAKSLLMPSRSSQISENELFFFNSKPNMLGKNTFRFGIISVE